MALIPYFPASSGTPLDTYVTESMAYDTQQALRYLRTQVGDVDEYVRAKCRFDSLPSLYEALGAEQIDSVAMAIYQIERGKGLIIGDQTGIGKGRQAAAIIRYGIEAGMKVIFLTVSPGLMTDMYRDLIDIGYAYTTSGEPVQPLIFNDATKITRETPDGGVETLYESPGNAALQGMIEGLSGNTLPPGYKLLMTTYSQLSSAQLSASQLKEIGKKPPEKIRPQFKPDYFKAVCEDALIIADEAHIASGKGSTVGIYMQDCVASARGVLFLSATYAKTPANMPLYAAKTAISDSGLDRVKLVEAFTKGGVSLQEIVAADLVREGQMVRRERSYQGIEVLYKLIPDEDYAIRKTFDKISELLRELIQFELLYIEPIVQGIDEDLRETGEMASSSDAGQGASRVPIFSKLFNIVDQVLFSVKAKYAALHAVKLLNEGKKVVIAFRSTMEAFTNEMGLSPGDQVEDMTFRLVMYKMLEKMFVYTIRKGYGKSETTIVDPSQLSVEGLKELQRLKNLIDNLAADLSISPIDEIRKIIERAPRPADVPGSSPFYITEEVTGRKLRISWNENNEPYATSFGKKINDSFRRFNSGESDVILVNGSGATGVSAHSSRKFLDQRQRVMILLQPALDVSKEVQMRGRINRTGQVNLPSYVYIVSPIPAETRLMMMLKNKLKSLDANTSGSQDTSSDLLEAPDFINKYGDKAVNEWIEENMKLMKLMGYSIPQITKFLKPDSDENTSDDDDQKSSSEAIIKRIPLLPIEEQARFYNAITDRYLSLIEEAKMQGTYDLEVEYLDYQAAYQRSKIAVPAKVGARTSFGDAVIDNEYLIKQNRKAVKMADVDEMVREVLNGMTPDQYVSYIQSRITEFKDEKLAKIQGEKNAKAAAQEEKRISLIQRIDELTASIQEAQLAERPTKKLSNRLLKAQDDLAEINEAKNGRGDTEEVTAFMDQYQFVMEIVAKFWPGRFIDVPEDGSINSDDISQMAVSLGVSLPDEITTLKNLHIKVILPGSGGKTSFIINRINLYLSKVLKWMAIPIDRTTYREKWNTVDASGRKEVTIAVGNMIAAAGQPNKPGRFIKFSLADGRISSGFKYSDSKAANKTQTLMYGAELATYIDSLKNYSEVSDITDRFTFKKQGGNIYFYIPSATSLSGPILQDDKLRDYLVQTSQEAQDGEKGQFRKSTAKQMVAQIRPDKLADFLIQLGQKVSFTKPAEYVQIDQDTVVDDTDQEELSGITSYLRRPGSLEALIENVTDLSGGGQRITTTRPLSSQERFIFDLVPEIAPDVSVAAWLDSPDIAPDADLLISQLREAAASMSPYQAYQTLGREIKKYPYLTGPAVYTFGLASDIEIGQAAYRLMEIKIQPAGRVRLMMDQLSTLMQSA